MNTIPPVNKWNSRVGISGPPIGSDNFHAFTYTGRPIAEVLSLRGMNICDVYTLTWNNPASENSERKNRLKERNITFKRRPFLRGLYYLRMQIVRHKYRSPSDNR